MKVMIHGAANKSNFGDILFAKLFYDEALKDGYKVDFLSVPKYGIGDFCRREIGYKAKGGIIRSFSGDALVLMSGGYFGDSHKSLKGTVKRYVRYILPAEIYLLKRKPVYIIGVGGGPIFSAFLRRRMVRLFEKAKQVIVRDQETADYFIKYGVKREIEVTADTAQVLTRDYLPELDVSEEIRAALCGKTVFIHAPKGAGSDSAFSSRVVPAVNRFLREHPDYNVIFGYDGQVSDEKLKQLKTYQALKAENIYVYTYKSVMQFAALLSQVDFVITTKLHVGIVSASLDRAVISFPSHLEKTERYYRQIGESGRTLHLKKVTEEEAYRMIRENYDKPIVLNETIREKAKYNLDVLKHISENERGK